MTVIPVLVYLLNTSEELLTHHLLTKCHIQKANVNCLSSEHCDTVVMYLFVIRQTTFYSGYSCMCSTISNIW